LASGQGAAVFADIGFVAVRQIDDEVVNAGRLRGREHSFGMGRPLEARNILRHVAGEQFDVLRQVADMPAKRLR
jgi:plasmid stability protein